ncbi:hypothetical protein [Niastella koreensis]|nr:hypothetical protein [Niastella koreensis]
MREFEKGLFVSAEPGWMVFFIITIKKWRKEVLQDWAKRRARLKQE